MESPHIAPPDESSVPLPLPQYDNSKTTEHQTDVASPEYANIDQPENNLRHPDNSPSKYPHWVKGDPRWISTSKWTATAPYVVLVLFVLSLIEIVMGVLWLVQTASGLTFQGVLQPLCVPCLSFFNTVPSGHLHLFAHANPPTVALWFSGILATIYLASSLLYTVSCTASVPTGLQRTECWRGIKDDIIHGPRKSVWDAVVVLSWFSFVGYFIHAQMAWKVRKWMAARPKDEHGIVLEEGREMDPVQKARREEEARERWRKIVDL